MDGDEDPCVWPLARGRVGLHVQHVGIPSRRALHVRYTRPLLKANSVTPHSARSLLTDLE